MIQPTLSLRVISLACAMAVFAMPSFAEDKKAAQPASAHAATHSIGHASTGDPSHGDKGGATSGKAEAAALPGKLDEHGVNRGGDKGQSGNGFGKQNPLDTANQVLGILQGFVPHR